MKTLREEMTKFLDSDDVYNKYEKLDIDYCVEGILKLFKKRIYEMIDNIVDTEEMDIPHTFHVYGYRNALLDVRSMLQ